MERKYIVGKFFINIIDLNLDIAKREEIVSSNPEWLQKISEKEIFLRQRVIIQVFERFEYSIKNKDVGISISYKDNE